MRRVAVILIATMLAGCLSAAPEDTSDVDPSGAAPIDVADVPDEATLEKIEEGVSLVWRNVSLPLNEEFRVPENASIVRAHADVGAGQGLNVDLEHAETGRRRCNTPYIESWNQGTTGEMQCSGLTAIDDLPTNWTASVSGPSTADVVRIDFLDTSLSGPAAKLDLDEVTPPTHDLQDTEETTITSFDGTGLYAQVTKPEGDGPFPTVVASSPYNAGYHASGQPAMWEYFVQDWAKRGYAIVMADVRGTGYSDGCFEVWGPDEQRDQKVLVDWVADQDWSDGHVGFYGQSYVGTTPTEAAVQDPDALDAIITVAPVVDAYRDWHFGGVPNGENVASPTVAYQAGVGTQSKVGMLESDPARSATKMANGVCDPTLGVRANDPRAVYDEFYEVRNFTERVDDVDAATMYTHGFEDPNVKSDMAVPWFNEIDAPKLGLFGHWTHQHPPRADTEALMVGWMEQYVKGKDLGFDEVANASIRTNADTYRQVDAWPPEDPDETVYHPDFDAGKLTTDETAGSATVALAPSSDVPEFGDDAIELATKVPHDLHVSGKIHLQLDASLTKGGNAHVAAYLHDEGDDDSRLVTFGMANLAHREGHDTWSPVPPQQRVEMGLPFIATDHVVDAGDTLRLVVRAAHAQDWFAVDPGPPGQLTLHGEGTELVLPLGETGQATTADVEA